MKLGFCLLNSLPKRLLNCSGFFFCSCSHYIFLPLKHASNRPAPPPGMPPLTNPHLLDKINVVSAKLTLQYWAILRGHVWVHACVPPVARTRARVCVQLVLNNLLALASMDLLISNPVWQANCSLTSFFQTEPNEVVTSLSPLWNEVSEKLPEDYK